MTTMEMVAFLVNMGTYRRLGPLGFALAKGLIRGLINRYPNPSPTAEIN